ncbi:eCIS core domain-containing protein [Saccharothrix luteola]|uniref:eCIS core domain-containing protein n=1 Tax=Saccharothrix luteola TaxID=2893018 RepID=UPI001E539E76|nr:DUF4157 domain-containing protein [Saccharothrix luteola]MCC8250478.1 DUF4157 domain-containing protein [Saccharothrix luteola]
MTRAVARPAGEPGKPKKEGASAFTRKPRELREVLAAPGHPIDLGLRRELESRLGHDFAAVRVHHDREAAELTELLGADAVTVGQDIFFGHGMFRPETPAGERLLVHELLHTAQVPHPLGALVQGRDTGSVSMPGEPVEQEAERVARSDRVEEPVAQVAQGAAWLRYATVNADRLRTERLDPATLVDRLVAGVLRSLRGDPTDSSRRVRAQLARFTPELREDVLIRLERRLSSAEYARVLEYVREAESTPGPVETPNVPEPVPDEPATGEPRPEEPSPGEPAPEEPQPEEPQPEEPQPEEPQPEEPSPEEPQPEEPAPEEEPQPEEEDEEKSEEEKEKEKEEEKKGEQDKPADEEAPAEGAPAEEIPAAQQPGAPGAQPPPGQGPPAGATPAPEVAPMAQQEGQVAPERVEAAAQAPDSPLVQHGLLERPETDERVEEQEKPIGLESAADEEVPVPEPEEPKAEDEERPEQPELKPEDHLPATDLDVSNVPTADRITLPASGSSPPQQDAPSFPSPPPTKAEQAEEQEPPERAEAPEPSPEPAPEPSPAAEREEEDEAPAEQPLDAEVGPEPTAEPPAAAPEPPGPVGADDGRAEATEPAGAAALSAPTAPTAFGGGPEAGPDPAGAVGPGAGPDLAGGAGPGGGADLGGGAGAGGGAVDAPGAASGVADGELGPGPAPEASLERGGGGCDGGPAPAEPEAAGGGGGCGGGGGGGGAVAPAPAEQQQAPPPDVSSQPPEAALSTVATLPPDKMQTSLSQVDAAASNDVAKEQQALQAAPPTTTRPSGAPQVLTGPPEAAPPGEPVQVELTKAKETQAAEEKRQAEAKRVEGENQAQQTPRPNVTGNAQGEMSEQEVRDVQDAVNSVPTTDPALNTTVGPAPKVELTGEQDPARTDEQTAELRDASTTLHTAGREESAKPMGEDQIFPNAPPETLTAQVPSAEGGGGGGPVQAGGADEGVAVVAQQERGAEIQAGVAQGQSQMGTERQAKQQGEAQAKADHEAQVAQQVQENSAAQADERGKVAADVQAQREGWRAEQDAKIEESNGEATKEHEASRTGIHKEKENTDKEVEQRQQTDNDKIQHEREQAEEKARKEKEAKKQESDGGFFGWLASKVKSFFEGLLNAITAIFNAAVAVVNGIIKTFATIVTGLIDAARNAIIGLINALADVLLKLCDVLALFFPELAARIRKGIEAARDAAIAAVNKLADALKAGVEFLLNKLAEALTGLLRLLEKGLKAAVELVRSAVNAAIEFAKAAIQMLGEFAAIIADIASMGVGTWLGRLGAAAVEGIRNHLWDAIKTAVRQWFNEKVQAIVGLGKTVIDVLIKGCFSMAKIGKMVWDAIIAALPMMIVAVVIERLVSLIVPAAGAVLAVVQGLMAAWGTISKIIAAIGAFIAFVKAVKAGPAACLFAAAVAAGVVALLEFITNFLMAKLAGAAKGVGGALKGMAKKIMAGLKRAGKGARKAASRAVNAARRGAQRAGAALRRPPGRPRPGRPTARPTRPGTPGRRPERPGRPQRPDRPDRPRRQERPGADSPKRRVNPVRNAVANGVKRVATTLKKVGRKIANSKIGKSLRNTAKKLRDKYRNYRDRIKDKLKKNRDKKAKEKNKPKPDDKNKRLQLIVARIKPKLSWLLSKGVRGKVLRATLFAMRIAYRLTRLERLGQRGVDLRATLNPVLVFLKGVAFVVDDVLRFVRKVSAELSRAPQWAHPQGPGSTRPQTTPVAAGTPTVAHEFTGQGAVEVQEYLRNQPPTTLWQKDLQRYTDTQAGGSVDVIWQQWFGRSSRNRGVRFNIPKSRQQPWIDPNKKFRATPDQALSYEELSNLFASWRGPRSVLKQQAIARSAFDTLRGEPVRGPNPRFVREVTALMIHQETLRSVVTRATGGMLLDMAARGHITMAQAAAMHPMGIPQARAASQELHQHLMNRGNVDDLSPGAREVRLREAVVVEAWVRSLGDEIVVDSQATAEEKRKQIYRQIRERIHRIYGIHSRYTAERQRMDGLA